MAVGWLRLRVLERKTDALQSHDEIHRRLRLQCRFCLQDLLFRCSLHVRLPALIGKLRTLIACIVPTGHCGYTTQVQ